MYPPFGIIVNWAKTDSQARNLAGLWFTGPMKSAWHTGDSQLPTKPQDEGMQRMADQLFVSPFVILASASSRFDTLLMDFAISTASFASPDLASNKAES